MSGQWRCFWCGVPRLTVEDATCCDAGRDNPSSTDTITVGELVAKARKHKQELRVFNMTRFQKNRVPTREEHAAMEAESMWLLRGAIEGKYYNGMLFPNTEYPEDLDSMVDVTCRYTNALGDPLPWPEST